MCDQTEVTYSPGDVVWVKLGPVWWPGQVQDYASLPEEITHDLRKQPIAVVKFFQEDSYEYVKNLNQIYHYNCRKKEEFIKKGLDMVRSSNTRDVPSNMSMFPNDIVMAEHLTGGDPNILESEVFVPEQKPSYSDLFGSAKKSSGKKGKVDSLKKELKRQSDSPIRNGRRSLPTLPATIPRPITHPRFITKALEGKSDHEVRIRCQISAPKDDQDSSENVAEKKYKCYLCDFQSSRLNVIVLHNKSHSTGFIEAQNATKARLKSREKERLSLGSNLFSEQTPTAVTSRGRVKSLPKKLLDYTDEPPPKMLKEKLYVKHVKEETSEPPDNVVIEKTPKKQKEVPEKASIKRPLFGKRKTAKEKAELAAKQKQENEAMKETLLKDWDDDDVNQEEVELERLKQALESTTSSLEDEVDSSEVVSESKTDVPPKATEQDKEHSLTGSMSKSSGKVVKDDIKSKVFEFDDSEDSLPVNINFRLKSKQEKFTDDKFKKPRPPKPLSRPKSKLSSPSIPPPPLFNEKKDEDKETEDKEFTEAFNALLEETALPVLPEIPKTSLILNTSSGQFSDQTSDISSSTDLMETPGSTKISDLELSMDVTPKQDSDLMNNDLRMECTSSDNEEVNTSDQVDLSCLEAMENKENQKNMKEVSAVPSAETNSEVISSGVATTTTCDLSVPMVNEGLSGSEDVNTTEITSTCDGTKSVIEDAGESIPESNGLREENDLNKTGSADIDFDGSATDDISAHIEEFSKTVEESNYEDSLKNNSSDVLELNPNTLVEPDHAQETIKDDVNDCLKNNLASNLETKSESSSLEVKNVSEPLEPPSLPNEVTKVESVVSVDNIQVPDNIVKEETIKLSNDNDNIKEDINKTTLENEPDISKQFLPREVDQLQSGNLQFILPVNSQPNTTTVHTSSAHQVETILVPKLDISESSQTLSQSLQDMELDINSMPVIIGGEDFMQPEQSKPNVIPIQPKYSESIVISPKSNTSNSGKPESVIMHLGEPSTSNQNVQSVIAIPSKGGKSGNRGGRSQKSTSKTIKLSASALKDLGSLQKGGNQQVLILKTSSSKDNQDKGSLQKTKGPLNLIQHGNKILIVNNPMSGQNKIKLNPQQQQLLTGGKLAPGTRVFTSKVVATTSPSSNETIKTSSSRSIAKPTQKLIIGKGGLLASSSKSLIINSGPSGKMLTTVPCTQTITNNKGQTLITHSIINTKGGLILPSSSQSISSSGKTTTIITSQSLPSSKGMILTPITSKGGQILPGNPKLRIVSSKAQLSGTKFVVQNPQGKITAIDPQHKGQQIKLISGLKGQAPGNTILIQTSQGLVAKPISPSTITTATNKMTNKSTGMVKTVVTTIPTQAKIRMATSPAKHPAIVQKPQTIQQSSLVQHTQIIPHPQTAQSSATVKKVAVQKNRQSPNILQKTQRKSTPRVSKTAASRSVSQPPTSVSEPIILSTSSNLPVITQSALVQGQIPQSADGLVYLAVDDTGNYRQIDSKSLLTFEGNPTEGPRTIYIPTSSQPPDVGNIIFTIDDAGMTQFVNIAQPAPSTSFTPENSAPAQDILAKALANTQVLQQETIIPDVDVTSALAASVDSNILANASFTDQTQCPAPSLSHSVQETSLTLTQPIMTPLEVPSNVSPGLGQISSLPSNYITTNLITPKQKHIHPSMPLLTEESLTNQSRGEPVFLLDTSSNIIPSTSGSQISFQLTLDNNIVTMSSGTGGSVLPQTYQVVSGDLSQLVTSREAHNLQKVDKLQSVETSEIVKFERNESMTFSALPETEHISSEQAQSSHQSGILREALEAPQGFKSENFLNSVEMAQSESLAESDHTKNTVKGDFADDRVGQLCKSESVEIHAEQVSEEFVGQNDGSQLVMEEVKHSLKRSLGEEQTVTSSSDPQDDSKRIRLDER